MLAKRPLCRSWLCQDARYALLALSLLWPTAGLAGPTRVNNYVIGPQDILIITVFEQQDLGGKYVVDADGTFSFPLIGRIKAGGLTLRELEAALKGELANGFFKNPQVSVSVEQYRSQRVFVVG